MRSIVLCSAITMLLVNILLPGATVAQPMVATGPSAPLPSLESLIQAMPAEYAASADGSWDEITWAKVQRWIRNNVQGKRCAFVTFARSSRVWQKDADNKPDAWTVGVALDVTESSFRGVLNKIEPRAAEVIDEEKHVIREYGVDVTLQTNEAGARRWLLKGQEDRNSKAGEGEPRLVWIEGELRDVEFDLYNRDDKDRRYYSTKFAIANPVLRRCGDVEAMTTTVVRRISYIGVFGTGSFAQEIKLLEKSGDYCLVYLSFWPSSSDRASEPPKSALVVVRWQKDDYFAHYEVDGVACSKPPTATEMAEAKSKLGWKDGKAEQ